MDTFNITEFMKKEMKEYEREHADYIKVKAYYGFQGKRTHQEMTEERLDIKSPHPSELPMPSEKFLNKN
jgi:hypothetical protein